MRHRDCSNAGTNNNASPDYWKIREILVSRLHAFAVNFHKPGGALSSPHEEFTEFSLNGLL